MIGYVRPEMRFDGLPALVWRVESDAILVESAVVLYTPGGYPWRVPLEGTPGGYPRSSQGPSALFIPLCSICNIQTYYTTVER